MDYLIKINKLENFKQWKDNALKWNRSQYGNVFDIRLPVNRIWTPGKLKKKL